MSFIDVTYMPFGSINGNLTVAMNDGLPILTSDPEVIVANLSTLAALTIQGELPQNTEYGVPSSDKIGVLVTNIDKSQAAKAAIIQKVAQDVAGSISDIPGLTSFTQNVRATTTITGGPTSE